MRVALIGTGISGLTAAYLLQPHHDITVYEAASRIGGHTATVDVAYQGRAYAVDTGFMVYNERTYPHFTRLLQDLGVASQPTAMGFSVRCPDTGFEYCGRSPNAMFAQRRNLVNPAFWRMLRDIWRFNRETVTALQADRIDPTMTLGAYLAQHHYGDYFIKRYLIPMGAAIWSASTDTMYHFPLRFFVRFFHHHGLLSVGNRPQWRTICGGAQAYVQPLMAKFSDRIRLHTPVQRIERKRDAVHVTSRGHTEHFDTVIIATHSDQALRMLADPSPAEQDVLGAIPYQDNEVILHTDHRLLPRRRRAWASWNYLLTSERQHKAVLTYNMNILQRMDAPTPLCITLNHTAVIDERKILARLRYSHPVFTLDGIRAQTRWAALNGVNRTYYCGAYWANGFHEDGVVSAMRVCQALGIREILRGRAPCIR